MGVVEDVRKVLQDVVSPDLKALDARVAALEKRLDIRLEALEERISGKIDKLSDRVDSNDASVMHALDIDRRMERIENQMANQLPPQASRA